MVKVKGQGHDVKKCITMVFWFGWSQMIYGDSRMCTSKLTSWCHNINSWDVMNVMDVWRKDWGIPVAGGTWTSAFSLTQKGGSCQIKLLCHPSFHTRAWVPKALSHAEHLVQLAKTLDLTWLSMRPGGFLLDLKKVRQTKKLQQIVDFHLLVYGYNLREVCKWLHKWTGCEILMQFDRWYTGPIQAYLEHFRSSGAPQDSWCGKTVLTRLHPIGFVLSAKLLW